MAFNLDLEITEYERLRQKNMKELQKMMLKFEDDIDDSIDTLNDFIKPVKQTSNKRRKTNKADPTFTFTGVIPFERRHSGRLSNTTPLYTYEDLIDEKDVKLQRQKYSDDVDNLEKVVFRKKKSFPRRSSEAVTVDVKEITQKYINNVSTNVASKVYCAKNGTSCHQCRQKTLDSKTYCRSGRCVGVRGQFCGVCLKNRYGEIATQVLLDPEWECPPCRGLCNCSICRTREGKRPTGILAPLAFQNGHKSVKDFLNSLNGIGDYTDKSSRKTHLNNTNGKKKKNIKKFSDNEDLLIGFNSDLKPLWICKNKMLTFSDEENDLVGFNKDNNIVMTKS